MPLPILTEREWDEGLYDGWLYDGRAAGPLTPLPATGSVVPRLGNKQPAQVKKVTKVTRR